MIDLADMLEYYRSKKGYKNNYIDDSFLNDTREEKEFIKRNLEAIKNFCIGDIVENFDGNLYKIIKINSDDIEAYNMICYTKTGRIKKGSRIDILAPAKIRKI